jgi:hypothetical protein
MLNAVRIFLAIALLFATTGVTVTSVACEKEKQNSSCPSCTKNGMPKSCCMVTAKHLSVKSEFGKPAPSSSFSQVLHVAGLDAARPLRNSLQSPSSFVFRAAPPRTSVEECALLSQFRI